MRSRTAGLLIIGIAALIGFIIFMFTNALTEIVATSCGHGETCPMWQTIDIQRNIGLGILLFVVIIGLYLIFFVKDQSVTETPSKAQKKPPKDLDPDEKALFNIIVDSEGTIFQSDLVEKSDYTKVKVTRILDKLEGKALIERKRRGMTNIVILKH